MPPPIATGNNNPNYHPTELLFDPRRGMSFRQHVTCGKLTATAQAQLLAIVNQVQGLGASGKMVFSQEKPSLEYELVGVPSNLTSVLSEMFFDDWQVQNDDLTANIFTDTVLTNYPAYRAPLDYNARMVLQRYAKLGSGTAMKDVVASLNDDVNATSAAGNPAPTVTPPNPSNGGSTGTGPTGYYQFQMPAAVTSPSFLLAQELVKMIEIDQVDFLDPLPVLTHTSVCSPGSNYNVSRANEMCIYTPAQLLSEVGSGWTNNLPPRLYSQISSFPYRFAPPDSAAFYTWGWLKTRATQNTLTNFMVEMHQEYKLNLWANFIYALKQ
jgi:hypothetical protein